MKSTPQNPNSIAAELAEKGPVERDQRTLLRIGIAFVWMFGFAIWFHSFGLPNNHPATRLMIWSSLVYDLLDIVDPPVVPNAAPWSWFFLMQRIPFLAIAVLIWIAAIGVGLRILGRLGLCSRSDRASRGMVGRQPATSQSTGDSNSPVIHTDEVRGHSQFVLNRAEQVFLGGALGLAIISLVMLALGLLGWMSRWPLLVIVCGFIGVGPWLSLFTRNITDLDEDHDRLSQRLKWKVLLWLTPFVFCLLLGAMSPQTDFDVIEYHLGGPKEWFQQGRISYLPHNVYTSFPFLTEMLILCGMVIYGDWEWGALAGQAAIAGFAPLTAIGLYGTGARWFGKPHGLFAALVWLTTPWAYRISIIAYAEGGLACYLFAALAACLPIVWSDDNSLPTCRLNETPADEATCRLQRNLAFVTGLLSGSAMACKYTGLVSVVIPIGVILLVRHVRREERFQKNWKGGALKFTLFGFGVILAIAPWLVKNAIETGNPVYPLAYSIFGGDGINEELAAKWKKGHAAVGYATQAERLKSLCVTLSDVMANNDWHSCLMFALAPISLLASWRRKVWLVWGFVVWQFLSWFAFTHHIDRFYVPMFPALALLAGAGLGWLVSQLNIDSRT
ncbi:MAG: hypothetical protein FJ267_01020, partial [Planctomycetes bacterium]|nr:hypothetical protein [Planctomycetota bacterium]